MRDRAGGWGVDWFEIVSENSSTTTAMPRTCSTRRGAPPGGDARRLAVDRQHRPARPRLSRQARRARRAGEAGLDLRSSVLDRSRGRQHPRSAADAAHRGEPRPCRRPGAARCRTGSAGRSSSRIRAPISSSPAPQMPECEYLARLAEEADCGLLLDVNNVHVSAFNHGFDPVAYIEAIPAERIVQVHLAGPQRLRHPPARHPRFSPVLDAGLGALRAGDASEPAESPPCSNGIPSIPPCDELLAELAKARAVREGLRPGPPSASRSAPMAEPALPALQHWLQECILAGGAAGARTVAGDGRLSAGERVAIYAEAYRARLLETLRDEYPALRLLVGDTVFDLFAQGFLAAISAAPFQPLRLGRRLRRPSRRDPAAGRRPHAGAAGGIWPGSNGRARRSTRAGASRPMPPAPVAADAALLPGTRLAVPGQRPAAPPRLRLPGPDRGRRAGKAPSSCRSGARP